ncbi:MAG: shikimate kinase [Rickettsiaceae bacterium H1]|nr:shikimate kinase [Rickettsiaceae bacterium H1]
MGSGKSTIAKELSLINKKTHFDTDKIIESKISVPEIFRIYGEKHFRKLEYQITCDLIKNNTDCIISTGGGAFIQKNTRSLLLQQTYTIWLKNNFKTILRRIKNSNRPLASSLDKEFFEHRNKIYEQAKMHIDCDELTSKEIALKIFTSM